VSNLHEIPYSCSLPKGERAVSFAKIGSVTAILYSGTQKNIHPYFLCFLAHECSIRNSSPVSLSFSKQLYSESHTLHMDLKFCSNLLCVSSDLDNILYGKYKNYYWIFKVIVNLGANIVVLKFVWSITSWCLV